MIQVIDLIETTDIEQTKSCWEPIAIFLSGQPGYLSATLLETFHAIHPKGDFKITSISLWKDNESWLSARQAALDNQELAKIRKSMPAKFTANKFTVCNSHDISNGVKDKSNMVLVDVVEVEPERMKGYKEMWDRAKDYMKNKPGFVSADLHVNQSQDTPIKYINIAEWRSAEEFEAALTTEEFLNIIDEYKENFALYLSKKVMDVPSKLKKAI